MADDQELLFGVSGHDLDWEMSEVDARENRVEWNDGSVAGYEPGIPGQYQASLAIPTQGCLYQVWTELGETHLLHLLSHLRPIEGLAVDAVSG